MFSLLQTSSLRTFLISLLALVPLLANAQYEEYRTPQDKDEIARYRRLGVSYERKFLKGGKTSTSYVERSFDTMGRLTVKIIPTKKLYHTYDEKGRLILTIDSSKGGEEYFRSDYEFEYFPNGMPHYANLPPFANLTFKYDDENRTLFESTMVDYEQYRKRYFHYDAQGRIKDEEWYYPNGDKERIRKVSYNHVGKPFQEYIVKFYKNRGLDSQFVTYKHDEKGRLLEQSTISFTTTFPMDYDSLPLLNPKPEVDTVTYRYTYNIQGNKSSEIYHYSVPGYDHKYEWWYDAKGLKDEENLYGPDGTLKARYNFEYKFYPDKQKVIPQKGKPRKKK